jgi:hypothetical protein
MLLPYTSGAKSTVIDQYTLRPDQFEFDFDVFSQVDSAKSNIRKTALRQTKSVSGMQTDPMTMQTGNRYECGRGKKKNISNKLGISKTTEQARMRIDSAICQLILALPSITLMNFI